MSKSIWLMIAAFALVALLLIGGIFPLWGMGCGWAAADGWGMRGSGIMWNWPLRSIMGSWFFWSLGMLFPPALLALAIFGIVWLVQHMTALSRSATGLDAAQPGRRCGTCGQPVQADWRLCPYCGQALAQTETAPPRVVQETDSA
jgi:hypothetical protein